MGLRLLMPWTTSLESRWAHEVVGLATNAENLGRAGEGYAVGAVYPDLAHHASAADDLLVGVVCAACEGSGHASSDGFQQVWPVAFHRHDVVRLAVPVDVVSGRVLGMSCVHRDCLAGQVDLVEESRYAGDLGGVLGHGDLSDDDLFFV
jgi:hypothetical protein